MKKLFLFLIISFSYSSIAYSACTGSGLTWSCAAGSTTAQIQAAYAAGTDGMTITFATGSYDSKGDAGATGNNHWLKGTNSKGATFACAVQAEDACIVANSAFMDAIFGFTDITGTTNSLYRITGFTFDTVNANNYYFWLDSAISTGTLTAFRVDHNWFKNIAHQSIQFEVGGSGHCVEVYGVIDHNSFIGADSFHPMDWSDSMLPSAPCPDVARRGTANNLFWEDNIITMTTNPNPGGQTDTCIDGFGNGSIVWRYNTSTNCQHLMHGVAHGGGPANLEWYNNNCIRNSQIGVELQDGSACYWSQGAGLFLAFNNIITPAMGAGESGVAIDNQYSRTYYNDTDGNPWGRLGTDYSGASFAGTADIQNNIHCSKFSTASYVAGIFWSMAAQFGTVAGGAQNYKFLLYDNADNLLAQSSSLTAFGANLDNYAFNAGTSALSASTSYTLCIFGSSGGDLELYYRTGSSGDEIIDTTATWPTVPMTLTHSSTGNKRWALSAYNACDGTSPVDDPGLSGWPGNNAPISTHRGYPCWHQPGRDYSGNLNPQYGFNNIFAGTLNHIDAGAFNSGSPPSGSPDYSTNHLLRDRDFYTDNHDPFTGTAGVGVGLLADRPATCTPTPSILAADSGKGGVGYWAVDQGSWNSDVSKTYKIYGSGADYTNGVLYLCDATNHWVVGYTPFTYPHPLVNSTTALGSITPSSADPGDSLDVIITGFLLSGTTCVVSVSGSGVTVSAATCVNANTITAHFAISAMAASGLRTVTVTIDGTPVGNSLGFTINTISSCTPDHLTFISQPSSAVLSASLGTIVVGIYNSSNVLCNTATDAITLSKNAGATWNSLHSSSNLTQNAVNGISTWTDLYISPTIGAGTIDAGAVGINGTTSNSITISAVPTSVGGGINARIRAR